MKFEQSVLPRLTLLAGLLVVLAIYSLGWTGTLHFDDEPNLNGLYGISDWFDALRFIFSGEAGPTGRPVSLATFALQHESWPNPKPFLIFNTLVHVVNGLLCFLLIRRLLGWICADQRSAEWLAVTVTLLWAASPLLANASLMVVQRMTGLSAFFALLFMVFYTAARPGYRPDSVGSNLWLASIVGAGTLLGGLAKENGFLLPVMLLLIEWLLVPNSRRTIKPLHRLFWWVVLGTPLAIVLSYLVYRGFSGTGYLYRDFTLAERLMTQPRAILDYISKLLLPVSESITPFQDAYSKSTGLLKPVSTIISIIALCALLGAAWLVRRSQPMIAFGLFWYFAGHLSESTVVPLELYFAHRNYLPAIGVYLALILLAMNLLERRDFGFPVRSMSAAAYFFVFLAVLANGTAIWGDRQLAAEMWYVQDRKSERAAQYLYLYYAEEGQVEVAGPLIDRFVRDRPGEAIFSLQALAICDESKEKFDRKMDRAVEDLTNERVITTSMSSLIQQFAALAKTSDCAHFGLEQAERIADAGLATDAIMYPSAEQGLLFAKAQIAEHRGNYSVAIRLLERSLKIRPALDAAVLITYFHTQAGDLERAREFLRETIAHPPVVGLKRKVVWRLRLIELLTSLSVE